MEVLNMDRKYIDRIKIKLNYKKHIDFLFLDFQFILFIIVDFKIFLQIVS